jgi:hypothetical protein
VIIGWTGSRRWCGDDGEQRVARLARPLEQHAPVGLDDRGRVGGEVEPAQIEATGEPSPVRAHRLAQGVALGVGKGELGLANGSTNRSRL